MAGAMHNWQRALCARETEPEWEVIIRVTKLIFVTYHYIIGRI